MKRKSAKYIQKLLQSRKLEDLEHIAELEKNIKRIRGSLITPLKENEPVILLVSGGLDSTIVWEYLLKEYASEVYPLFIRRGQRRVRLEEQAVDFFETYFSEKYPGKSHPVMKMDAAIPPLAIRFPITIASNDSIDENGRLRGIPLYSQLLFHFAVQYGYYLELTQKRTVRKIFAGFAVPDGTAMRDETLTAIRMAHYSTLVVTDDPRWEISALPIEKELGFFHDKHEFLKWAHKNNFPFEKTRTCIQWKPSHCGTCLTCEVRQMSFQNANMDDPTVYLHEQSWYRRAIEKARALVTRYLKL